MLRDAVPAAVAAAGIDAGERDRHRHRLHRLHAAAGAARRHAAVPRSRASRAARTRTRSCGSTTRPRRQADRINALAAERGEPWLARYGGRISSEWEFAKALQVLEEDPEVYDADGALDRGGRLDRLAAVRRARRATSCTAGYKGIHQDGRYPSPRLPGRARRALRRLRRRQARRTRSSPLGAPRRRPDRAGGGVDGAARGHRRRGRQRRRARDRAGRAGDRARADAGDHGHVHLPRHERRRGSPRCPACAAWSTAGSCPALWGYEAGQSGVGDIFGWFVDNAVPPRYHDEARARARPARAPVRAAPARQAVGEHGLIALDWHSGNRSVLVDHELSGLIVGLTLAHARRGRLPGADRGDRVRHAHDRRDVRRRRACPSHEFVRRRRAAQEPGRDADLRRRDPPAAAPDRLRAGPGARLGDPRRGRRRRLSGHPRGRGGDGARRARRVRARSERAPTPTTRCTSTTRAARPLRPRRRRRDAPRCAGCGRGSVVPCRRRCGASSCALHDELPRNGLVAWTSGNVSARVPGEELMVIKPSGVPLRRADAASRWSSATSTATWSRATLTPSSDAATHGYVYRRMPDVGGVAHTHSPYATAWAIHGEPMPCVMTAMADEFGGEIPIGPFALIGDEEIGRGIVDDAGRPPLARRAHAQPRRLHRRADRARRGQGGGHVRGRRAHRAPRPRPRATRAARARRTSTRSMTATRTSTASAERRHARPARGSGARRSCRASTTTCCPGITERQARLRRGGRRARWRTSRTSRSSPPVKERADAEARDAPSSSARDLDGVLVVMLTYGPAMRVARLLAETRLPVCLANIQPVPAVTPAWDMADLTYNQGIHGAQDTANAMVRAGRAFHVVTDDWQLGRRSSRRVGGGRAPRPRSRAGARCKVAVFGYAMNGMGDIRVDVHTLLRDARPAGRLARARRPRTRRRRGARGDVRALIAGRGRRASRSTRG